MRIHRITPKDITTYKFSATINDTKSRDQFIKGPLKLQTVLETIELDSYNHKNGEKNPRSRKQKRISLDSSANRSQVAPNQHGNGKHLKPTTRKYRSETVTFAVNQTGQWTIYTRHGRRN